MSEEMKTKLLSNQTKSLDWCVSILPTWKMNYKNGFPPILSYHLTRVLNKTFANFQYVWSR